MTESSDGVKTHVLKFLFVSADKYPPFRVDVTDLFAKKLANNGHQIDWILQSESECEKAYTTDYGGGKVIVGATDIKDSPFSRAKKYYLSIYNDFQLVKIVKNNHYDFVQVKDKFIAAIFAIFACRKNNTKFFLWLSYPMPEAYLHYAKTSSSRYPRFDFIRGTLLKWLLYTVICPKSDHIFVQSEQMKKDMANMGVPLEKMTPVPMGVSLETLPYDSSYIKEQTDGQHKTVVYLGTIIKARKMDFLIRAFKHVLDKIPDCKLLIVGGSDDVTDQELLENESKHIGIEKSVEFTGLLPRDEALQYIIDADVCVSPFYPTPILNSTSPTKLVEYMAMGKAVVANDHPEQKLIIENSQAGICVPYEEKAFADAIIEVLNNPASAVEMGKRGRLFVEQNRSYDIIAKSVESKYLQLLNSDH